MKISDIKNPAELLALLRESGTANLAALNGLLATANETQKPALTALQEKLTGLLARLPALDGDKLDFERAFHSLGRSFNDLLEFAGELRGQLTAAHGAQAKAVTSLQGLEQQLTAGELVKKDTAKAAGEAAVTEALKAPAGEIAGLRKQVVSLAGLPDAPAGVLESAPADFEKAIDQAKKNLKAVSDKGITSATFVARAVWQNETAFHGSMQELTELAASAKIKLPGGDPLAGGTGGTGAGLGADGAPKLRMA